MSIADAAELTVALAGNPNVGKSSVFNALTGLRQYTGNWAGKTVICAMGYASCAGRRIRLVDLPGSHALAAGTAEEREAAAFLAHGGADAIIVVCDAGSLERGLALTIEILDVTPRVVLALNLVDEARRRGITVDSEKLSSALGIPVVPTQARDGIGVERLLPVVLTILDRTETAGTSVYAGMDADARAASIAARAEGLARAVTRRSEQILPDRDARVDRVVTSKLFSFPLTLVLLALLFWITLSGANIPSRLLSEGAGALEALLREWLIFLPPWLYSLLLDGAYRVLAWVVSVMLPPMAIFFPLFTLLEDVGLLPRIAFNLDRAFCKCRACGKQMLTMCMSLGCNAVGVTGCRVIDSPRERLIAMLTSNVTPCNGRFPTLVTLLALLPLLAGADSARQMETSVFSASGFASSLGFAAVMLLSVSLTLGLSWLLSVTLLRGTPSAFTLELPPYRRPAIGKVLVRSLCDRTLFVLGRAVCIAAPAGVIIWCMANLSVGGVSLLANASAFLAPLARFMGLDGVILLAFILGFPANEIVLPLIVMGYLSQTTISGTADVAFLRELFIANGWTIRTAVSMILFTLMHWPCGTTCATLWKESKSVKWTLVGILLPTAAGIVLCSLFTAVSGWIVG
ncbi:MAG: ferrous iron transporter B [Clostridiaceae bacterium]|nr:ferrous iron transporter B [Clostridiaceae bacterium]